jgi:cytochrome P450
MPAAEVVMLNVDPPEEGFLADVAAAERQTPLPPPPPPAPDPNDPRYAGDPQAYERDVQIAAAAAAAWTAAVQARGAAVGQVVSRWLATAPYRLLQELLDQPREQMPIFKPVIGPAIVARHDHALQCLLRTDLFTVDPYAAEMARATDDKAKHPDAFSHFLLGTDRDDLYRLDDVILRRVVARGDREVIGALARKESEHWVAAAREGGCGEIDVVPTLAKHVPLRIVSDYLGVPYAESGEPSVLPGLHGGDPIRLAADLLEVFTPTQITAGVVPTADDLYGWVKDAFRNTFNNFSPAHPSFPEFRRRGIVATENLTVYVHALLRHYQEQLRLGHDVPDTMLTRLLRLQREVSDGSCDSLADDIAAKLGGPVPLVEIQKRLSDSMIRSNVFGTVVGAVVNPQEATARIADSMVRLADGEYEVRHGSTYRNAVRQARVEPGEPRYSESLRVLRRYALEALRLQPQGEVLLRMCVQDNNALGGVAIRRGTPVFVAFAAAMRDPDAVPRPLAFDVERDEVPTPYRADTDRAGEEPQSGLYLQHGYGRHKCLGRYASEITMYESLRALLRLGRLERRSPLQMDENQLYAVSLRLAFEGSR